ARRAARRRNGSVLELESALDDSVKALSLPDLEHFRRAALAFHIALARASGSPTIIELTQAVTARSFFKVPLTRERARRSHTEHARMLAAIKRGDAKTAAAIAARHTRSMTNAANRAQLTAKHHGHPLPV